MNIQGPQLFTPPRPRIPARDPGWYRFLAAAGTNALEIWPREAYRQDILPGSLFGSRRFLINSEEAIHRVLVENAANYRRTAAAIRILGPIVGEGLILSEGEQWRHQRRTIAPALAPRSLPVLAQHVVSTADEAIARLGAAAGKPVDLLAAMQLLALEIASRSMFSLEMQQHGAALRRLIADFATRLGRPTVLDFILPASIPSPRDLARRRFRSRWIALMDEIIEARLQAPTSEKPRDLFDLLLTARDPETGAAFTRAQLRDQVATMIVAGHETTALTLFWSMYLLASAPAEQEKMAQEVRAIDFESGAPGEMLPKLPYTRAVVSEALRLYPPAFAIGRKAIAADRLGSVAVSGGDVIMISPWVLHRHTRLWKDPDAFNPLRFVGRDPAAHRFAYMPFGAGPRVCVGAQFALTEAGLVLAMLVQRFSIALADDVPVIPRVIVTTQPDHPAPFRLRARN